MGRRVTADSLPPHGATFGAETTAQSERHLPCGTNRSMGASPRAAYVAMQAWHIRSTLEEGPLRPSVEQQGVASGARIIRRCISWWQTIANPFRS